MEKTKVLFISQEIMPYLPETKMSKRGRYLPQGIQEKGNEIRAFMPRFGLINERRNQLHEVIRLSGMNLIIDDTDHPLIIKVASIQSARMQVYFIDNEDYFHRKSLLHDENGKSFSDNDERAIFFAKGVIETVKKLRWSPDVVHCRGWFTSLVPLFLKKLHFDDPLFAHSKVILSVFDDDFQDSLNPAISDKVISENITKEDVELLSEPNYVNISKLGVQYSDGIIYGAETINSQVNEFIESQKKPVLEYQSDEAYIDAYSAFYDTVMNGATNS
ncbi:MAG: glycogen synthase [Bacteroidia bacterium]|nr:MAG: glycogen synthase [Bacteroidia bacterium]